MGGVVQSRVRNWNSGPQLPPSGTITADSPGTPSADILATAQRMNVSVSPQAVGLFTSIRIITVSTAMTRMGEFRSIRLPYSSSKASFTGRYDPFSRMKSILCLFSGSFRPVPLEYNLWGTHTPLPGEGGAYRGRVDKYCGWGQNKVSLTESWGCNNESVWIFMVCSTSP